jgi:hypothetical protein
MAAGIEHGPTIGDTQSSQNSPLNQISAIMTNQSNPVQSIKTNQSVSQQFNSAVIGSRHQADSRQINNMPDNQSEKIT